MAEEDAGVSDLDALSRQMSYALVKNCDMNEEMRTDCVENAITAIERYPNNYESAARFVKETMDKKYNESWVVIIGQGFAFEVTHEVKHVLWMFHWNIAILVYKAGARQAGA
eukprot:CAMPEP_0181204754 /NCGR_PEP_ID=MMETSP1096-20121128/20106_1 /TAXON_ID=156174 ORGANISM="Chrysochromulina ericina, Strain CCMP281" /NCGR_SAMPLE_ID=MMETSP1096 /ASSEMBLY_ACC=CAM_ASM_000453 /LENGTH=111 /DNA_ID=CAMNT_0023295479 /DNA_START=39 /DNA_END=374 /DNA_ORIENTATION=+